MDHCMNKDAATISVGNRTEGRVSGGKAHVLGMLGGGVFTYRQCLGDELSLFCFSLGMERVGVPGVRRDGGTKLHFGAGGGRY